MNITKVELLWARSCPFTCAGCRMPNNLRHEESYKSQHEGDLEQWMKGIENIRSLGAKFIAIYGAEPLTRPEHLSQVVDKIRSLGMAVTVITALPRSKQMRKLLDESTLNSVTVSYDAMDDADSDAYSDMHRKTKSNAGWQMLESNPQLDDRAVVATVTSANADQMGEMAARATERGYWFMFDLLHDDTGPLSKCGLPGALLPPTAEQGQSMAKELLRLKEAGMQIHVSKEYLELIINKYDGNPRNLWHCKGESTGWLTIDADGAIMPCDDWQKRYPKARIWDEIDRVDLAAWKDKAVVDCAGCAWNTHWDACAIERGDIEIGSYVHT